MTRCKITSGGIYQTSYVMLNVLKSIHPISDIRSTRISIASRIHCIARKEVIMSSPYCIVDIAPVGRWKEGHALATQNALAIVSNPPYTCLTAQILESAVLYACFAYCSPIMMGGWQVDCGGSVGIGMLNAWKSPNLVSVYYIVVVTEESIFEHGTSSLAPKGGHNSTTKRLRQIPVTWVTVPLVLTVRGH